MGKTKLTPPLALLLALLMLFSLAACSSTAPLRDDRDDRERETEDDKDRDDEDEDDEKADAEPEDIPPADPEGSEAPDSQVRSDLGSHTEFDPHMTAFWGAGHQGPPEQAPSLDAEAVYASLDYTPEMFYGRYFLSGLPGDCAWSNAYIDPEADLLTEFGETVAYMELSAGGQAATVSILPIAYEAGYETMALWLNDPYYLESGLHWMTLSFLIDNGGDYRQGSLTGTYTVEGDKLVFAPLADYIYDADGAICGVEYLDFTVELEYDFSGPYLTLSNGGQSVELCAYGFLEGTSLFIDSYARSGADPSPILGGADELILCHARYEFNDEDTIYFQVQPVEGSLDYDTPAGRFLEDGVVQLSWAFETDSPFETELVYFYCEDDGLILTDGKTTYYYTESYRTRESRKLADNLSEEDAGRLKDLSDSQLEQIVETREELLTELVDSFETAGLSVELDPDSGTISLDSTILFGLDEAALSTEGQAFLQEFLSVYASVILDGYSSFVSGILIEGHTDTQGSYDYNLDLSQRRADTVLEYCLSAANSLTPERTQELSGMLAARGCSYDEPVLDESGNVDAAASRRVSFRFLLRIGA